jgi:hypothetical protein
MDLPPLTLFDNKLLTDHNPLIVSFTVSLSTMNKEGSVGQRKCNAFGDAVANVASNNPLVVAREAVTREVSGTGYANS